MSCKRAQGFLEAKDWEVAEQLDATKEKQGRAAALALARKADKVIVAKGKKIVTFEMQKNPPRDDELAEHLLGPTGNLRAPTLLRGKTMLVGFNEDAYLEVLG